MTEVTLVGISTIDADTILTIGKEELGRKLNSEIDSSGTKLSRLAKDLMVWLSFIGKGGGLRDSGRYCEHITFSFLCRFDDNLDIIQVLEGTYLKCSSTVTLDRKVLCIISGTLKDWVDATMKYCSANYDKSIRQFFNKVMRVFFDKGLSEVWANYRQSYQSDKTFYLEIKE